MSKDAPPPQERPRQTVLRVRFVHDVKLGGSELKVWHADRTPTHVCEAMAVGLTFTPVKTGDPEVIVPWGNVANYERGLKS